MIGIAHRTRRGTLLAVAMVLLALDSTTADPASPEPVVSLLGRPLPPPVLSDEFRAKQEGLLAEARADLAEKPHSADALVWVGRRLAYLGRYTEAIGTYTRGIEQHPDDPRFLRHRGHRYISVRLLDKAIADFERAAQLVRGQPDVVEPDGLPNARGIPTSTLTSNIWYHLGLARYLKGDFEAALGAYRKCLEYSQNPDMLSATAHWLYMTLRRLGRDEEAHTVLEPITQELEIIENRAYHRLILMYRGEIGVEQLLEQDARAAGANAFPTTAYGVANWFLYNGDTDRADALFREIVDSPSWAAFGYLAAEAELARSDGP